MAKRLNGSPEKPAQPQGPAESQQGSCLECDASCGDLTRDAEFCTPRCRQAWNNRRLQRGAMLYDLFMASRYDRALDKTMKLRSKACTLVANFRQEDYDKRAGRRSWRLPTDVIQGNPHRFAKIFRVR